MQITIDLPHVFYPGASHEANADALQILLETLVSLNQSFLRNHTVPPLYRSGVVYGRTTVWDTIPAMYQRGYGDCKSLSAALIAEYRNRGIPAKPVFRFYSEPGTDRLLFHILVLRTIRGKTGWEDPSKSLGMGQNELRWFNL